MWGMNMSIALNVITGFLGSGKTSLLNALLADPARAGIFVIVNEVGAVGLDHLLVDRALDGAVVLENGCACCAVRGDLRSTLMTLAERVAAGGLPPLSHVVIETSGLVDPGPLVALFAADEGMRQRFALHAVATTVDAIHADSDLSAHDEARRQVLFADRVIVTKADIASADRLQMLHARIAALNPTAEIVVRDAETQPILVQAVHHRLAPPARLPRWPVGAKATRLVFIASRLDADLGRGLAASLARACPPPGRAQQVLREETTTDDIA